MRAAVLVTASALVLGSLVYFALRGDAPSVSSSSSSKAAPAAASSPALGETPANVDGELTTATVYRLAYTRRTSSAGQTVPPQIFRGTWTIEQVDATRTEIVFQPAEASDPRGQLDTAALAKPFQLGLEDGRLVSIGFDPGVGATTREALATLATAVQLTERDAARFVVDEEDLDGRYEARYERLPSGELRRVKSYTALRSLKGFNEKLVEALTLTGDARFTLDGEGLAALTIAERGTLETRVETGTLTSELEVAMVRERSLRIPRRTHAALELRPLHTARRPVDPLERERQILGDLDLPKILDRYSELASLPERGSAAANWRKNQLLRVRALLRLRPETAKDVARALRENPSADPRQLGSLTQALGMAGTPEARAALVELMQEKLPAAIRQRVAVALGVLESPTAETVSVLKTALDDATLGSAPALALGAEAQKLDEEQSGVRDDAVETLLDRYRSAGGYREQRVYLEALANSGDPRALAVMTAALGGSDARLAEVAAFGLRFIPGAEADAALEAVLENPGPTGVRVQAVRAAGFRDRAIWRPQLEELLSREREAEVRSAIERVLAS